MQTQSTTQSDRTVEVRVSTLYTVKASAYANEFNLTARGGQKAFKRLEKSKAVAPQSMSAIAGLPVVEFVGDRLFMLAPYFEAIRIKHVRSN